ncbi:MAG: DapH/DapD/GlmU-related protein [Candidatus Sericytochromatia bacterium]
MRSSLILYDIFLFLVVVGVYGSAFALAAWFLGCLSFIPWPWLGFALPVAGIVFVLGVILAVGILNLLLPNMKEGYYASPLSKGFYLWIAYLALNRMICLMPIKNIVLYSSVLRWLAFRALGARLAYASSISADVDFVDLPLIEIGEGCVIGAYSMLTGHYLNKGNLYLGHIKIGKRVNLGGYCRIGPGVEIGDDSWIGADCQIAPMVVIGAGCTIEPMTVIPPGTRIPPGQTYPPQEQEIWGS